MVPEEFMRHVILALTLAASTFAACGGGKAVSSTIEDASITAQVKTVLLNDTEMNATKIDVSTSNGVVVMSGYVASPGDQERAIQLARQVSGVRDVKANLTIGP
jgi:hyperosmotically inducible protein